MISLLRRKLLNGPMFKVMIWLTIFALGGFSFMIGLFKRFSRQQATFLLDVGGYEVSPADMRRKTEEELQKVNLIKQRFGSSADIALSLYGLTGSPEERAKKALVRQKLLLGVADSFPLEVSEPYLVKRMADPEFVAQIMSDYVPYRFLSKAGVNYQSLFKMLQRQNISAQCFEAIFENRVKALLVEEMLLGGVYVPQDVVREHYDREYRRRKFSVVKLPLDSFMKKAQEVTVDASSLKKFFEESNQRTFAYWTPEKRSGIAWTFSTISGDFKKDAEQVLLQHGSQFDDFVKKHKGIRMPLGPVEFGQDRLARKLFELKQGGRGIIVDGKQGFVVELERIDPRAEQSFESVKAKVRADYDHMQASKEITHELDALKKADSSWNKRLDAFHARHPNISVMTTDFVAPRDTAGLETLQKDGVPVHQMMHLSRVGESAIAINGKFGYFMELVEFEPLDVKDFSAKRFELMRALDAQEGARIEATFVASLEKNVKITEGKKLHRRTF